MATLNFHPGGYRDAHDRRDRIFVPQVKRLPARADITQFCGPVYQQYRTQSCSANALAAALVLDANREDVEFALPSRLFIFYNARVLENAANRDAGTTIRDALKAYAHDGACSERAWPFRPDAVTKRPTRVCYSRAQKRPIVYHRIRPGIAHLRAALAQQLPFIFGIQAYLEPMTQAAKSAWLRLPRKSDTLVGGHALIAVGYDRKKGAFLTRNSVGRGYARNGFFWIPDAYFTDAELTYDFWVVGGKTG